jgi:hypothetical protein
MKSLFRTFGRSTVLRMILTWQISSVGTRITSSIPPPRQPYDYDDDETFISDSDREEGSRSSEK